MEMMKNQMLFEELKETLNSQFRMLVTVKARFQQLLEEVRAELEGDRATWQRSHEEATRAAELINADIQAYKQGFDTHKEESLTFRELKESQHREHGAAVERLDREVRAHVAELLREHLDEKTVDPAALQEDRQRLSQDLRDHVDQQLRAHLEKQTAEYK